MIKAGTKAEPEPEPEPEPVPYEVPEGMALIIASSNGHGKITVSPEVVEIGKDVTVVIQPEDGYLLEEVRINGKTAALHGRFTLHNVTGYTRIEAVFVPMESAEEWVNPFTDIRESDWFYADVSYACRKKWMNGVGGGLFDPQASLTRGTFVTVLYRFALWPETHGNTFRDVPAGIWYEEPVAWASECGIVNGIGDGLFGPNNSITREQMATMVYRFMKYCGYDLSAEAGVDLSGFADADRISDYAKDAMRWAVGSGLFKGRTATELAPGGFATRAEIATVFRRLEGLLK